MRIVARIMNLLLGPAASSRDLTLDSRFFHREQLGRQGLLIKPLPSYCEELRARRASQVVQCACSSPQNHGKSMPIQVAGVHSSLEPDLIAVGARSRSISCCCALGSIAGMFHGI